MILEQLAKVLRKTGESYTVLADETKIDRAILCRVMTGSGTGSCSTKTADKLCKHFGLVLVEKSKAGRGKK